MRFISAEIARLVNEYLNPVHIEIGGGFPRRIGGPTTPARKAVFSRRHRHYITNDGEKARVGSNWGECERMTSRAEPLILWGSNAVLAGQDYFQKGFFTPTLSDLRAPAFKGVRGFRCSWKT